MVIPGFFSKNGQMEISGEKKIRNAAKRSRQHARIYQRSSSTGGQLPPKVVFHTKLYSTKGSIPLKVIFHRRLSSTEGCLPPKVLFHLRLCSTKGRLPPMVVLHRRSHSTEGCLPPNLSCLKICFLYKIRSQKVSG